MKKFLLSSFVVGIVALTPHFSKVRASFDSAEMARKLINMTNAERGSVGLPALKENSLLTQAAYAKAADMLAQGYFSHTSPGGKAFYRWVDNAGYVYSAVGENLAVNLNMVSAEAMVSSWLNSSGHRANLLSQKYTESGMGVSQGMYQGQPAVFAVQIFATPKNEIVTATQESLLPKSNIDKKTVPLETQAFKNINVLGDSISTEITSPQLASVGKRPETSVIATSSLSVKNEARNHKSWLQKILDFLVE